MMGDMVLDETSCGPLCQHPQCWASNRRVERGLPRLEVLASKTKKNQCAYENLPTLKVQNILDDYGYSDADIYPSVYQIASQDSFLRMVHIRQRSASAPSTTVDNSLEAIQNSRAKVRGQSRRERTPSRAAPLEPIQASYPPKLSKVCLDQMCGPLPPSCQGQMQSPIYLWQPSEKDVQKCGDTPVDQTDLRPSVVSPKDLTEELIPATVGQAHSKKKMRDKCNKQTPTGGRPYTHPLKSPPPIARRTLPQDIDDGIAQLLSLPRDVILQIVEHTKESDLFDKEKVQALLARVMPHIHFGSHQKPTKSLESCSLPLHAVGILRNQKMPILEGKQKFEKPESPLKTSLPRMPLVLDRSEVKRSHQGRGDEAPLQKEHPRIFGTLPGNGQLLKRRITSVSAKSLPPLQSGRKVTKPFDYSIQSLDLALTPLPTPEKPQDPSTTHSGKASTLYVTMSSSSADDRSSSLLSTAKHPHLAVMRQDSPASSHHSQGSPDLIPSYSTYKGPHNTQVPYGTPAPVGPEDRESGQRTDSGSTVYRGTLQTIEEHTTAPSTPDTTAAGSLSIKPPQSVSPWEDLGRLTSQVTSTPTNTSPEVWPVVDEKSYLHSPENTEPQKKEQDIPETVAPPPSPAPSERSGPLEEDTSSTEGDIIQKVMDCNNTGVSDKASVAVMMATEGSKGVSNSDKERMLYDIQEDEFTIESQGEKALPHLEGNGVACYDDMHDIALSYKVEGGSTKKVGDVSCVAKEDHNRADNGGTQETEVADIQKT